MAGARDYNGGKFKELVLLFIARSVNDEGFGMVKLNKLLCRADFEAYRQLGCSITGETYQRQEFGPIARHLLIEMDHLASSGYLTFSSIPSGPHTRKVPVAQPDGEPDTSLFSEQELRIIDATVAELAAHGAKSVSEWSHEQFVGWRVRKDGEAIPYSSAILSLREPDEKTLSEFESRLSKAS
jgi:hypothetical protein